MMHHPDTKAAKERAWKEEFERKRARDPLVVAHASISALKRQRDELLEALEVLIQPYHGLNDKTLSASVSKARAAIAKAKGESA